MIIYDPEILRKQLSWTEINTLIMAADAQGLIDADFPMPYTYLSEDPV